MIDALIKTLTVAAALLLVASGAAKFRDPETAATMVLRLLRRAPRERRRAVSLVRSVGLGELAVGLAVIGTGARLAAALLAGAYLVFAAVALVLLRTAGTRTSCGCFGSADSPVGPAHLVLTVMACAAGLAAVARPLGPGAGLFDGGTISAVTAAVQAMTLAALGYLAVTSFPALLAARRTLAARMKEAA